MESNLKESYIYTMTDYKKKTVRELKAMAKQQGMVRYSRLRKAELISLLSPPPIVGRGHENNLLDAPIHSDSTPVLTPVPASLDKIKKSFKTLGNKTKTEINSFADWIVSYVPLAVKVAVNDKVQDLKMKVNNIFNTVYKHVNFKALMKKTEPYKITEPKTAIRSFTKQYTIDGRVNIDAESFLHVVQPLVVNVLEANKQTKVNFVLTCTMERVNLNSGQVDSVDIPFVSKTQVYLAGTNASHLYKHGSDKILESMASFQMHGSNWRFKSVSKLDINTVMYKPLNGSSYIPLPDNLAAKKAIINVKNDDDECFKWCITRALNPSDKNQERITKELMEQSKKLC
jgi:Rho termination factor, N-terminal domain